MQDTLRHPLDELAPDVPSSCVVYIATTDGVLRMCQLANFIKEQGLARVPEAVPNALPPQLEAALARAAQLAAIDEVGAALARVVCLHWSSWLQAPPVHTHTDSCSHNHDSSMEQWRAADTA